MTLPFIAIRNHWDPRSGDQPWTAYSSEADHMLGERILQDGPGKGFHECLNFSFDHPDNIPLLHLYLPPSCIPSDSRTDTSNLLVFIFTYKGGNQGRYPAHLVAIAGHTTLASRDGAKRTRAGRLYGEDLYWHLATEHENGCVLVDPLPMAALGAVSLTARTWGESLRYLQPVEAKSILELAVSQAREVASSCDGKKAIAAQRQIEVCGHLLDSYASILTGELRHDVKQGSSPRRGRPMRPDEVAGYNAEKYIYELELREVASSLRNLGRKDDPRQWIHWWTDLGSPYENHDISSVRFDEHGNSSPLLLEVKSSKASDFSTVHISDSQLLCAESSKRNGVDHQFVFVRTNDRSNPIKGSERRFDVSEVRPWLRPITWVVDSYRVGNSPGTRS